MKDIARLAEKIAHSIEKANDYIKHNWKPIVVLIWMLIVTLTLIQQQQTISEISTRHQVANMDMAVKDIRYSMANMEDAIKKMEHAITKMQNQVNAMQSSVNRIYTQVVNQK